MSAKSNAKGHLFAIFTIAVWGTTYISSKVILSEMTAIELLLIRFILGYLALCVASPKPLKKGTLREEILFAACGLTGITLYYIVEGLALTYTQAANVGVIIAAAPFFTAILMLFVKDSREKVTVRFLIGFVLAMTGIGFLSFGGAAVELHFLGDALAVFAAVMWAIYCVCSKGVFARGYSVLQATRRMFFYGLLFMVPIVLLFGFHPSVRAMTRPVIFLNLLFLGVVGCAVCFATWNRAVGILGAVKTSVYIYLTPVVTTVSSVLILKEEITPAAALGIVLTLAGLILSTDLKHEAASE